MGERKEWSGNVAFNLALYGVSAVVLLVSALRDRRKTRQALVVAWRSFYRVTPSMLGIMGLIGLVLTLIPASTIGTLFGNQNVWGILLVAAVGAVTLIPGIIAYPLAGSLVRQGAGVVPIAAFMTTLMMVGVVTAPLESHYFGRRFTLLRNGLSFVAALAIAAAMGVVLG